MLRNKGRARVVVEGEIRVAESERAQRLYTAWKQGSGIGKLAVGAQGKTLPGLSTQSLPRLFSLLETGNADAGGGMAWQRALRESRDRSSFAHSLMKRRRGHGWSSRSGGNSLKLSVQKTRVRPCTTRVDWASNQSLWFLQLAFGHLPVFFLNLRVEMQSLKCYQAGTWSPILGFADNIIGCRSLFPRQGIGSHP